MTYPGGAVPPHRRAASPPSGRRHGGGGTAAAGGGSHRRLSGGAGAGIPLHSLVSDREAPDREALIDELGRAIKRFAKRQMVWFKKDRDVLWLDTAGDALGQAEAAADAFFAGRLRGVTELADSNITKRALAQALKELMASQPLEKISVGGDLRPCDMNRKSFYYHFKDKYDLVEWIFYTEFISLLKDVELADKWAFLEILCDYFYRERTFYVRALEVRGQNSFRDYFREFFYQSIEPFLCSDQDPNVPEKVAAFYSHFVSDAVLLAIIRWLTEGTRLTPEEFVDLMKETSELLVHHIKEHFTEPKDTEG